MINSPHPSQFHLDIYTKKTKAFYLWLWCLHLRCQWYCALGLGFWEHNNTQNNIIEISHRYVNKNTYALLNVKEITCKALCLVNGNVRSRSNWENRSNTQKIFLATKNPAFVVQINTGIRGFLNIFLPCKLTNVFHWIVTVYSDSKLYQILVLSRTALWDIDDGFHREFKVRMCLSVAWKTTYIWMKLGTPVNSLDHRFVFYFVKNFTKQYFHLHWPQISSAILGEKKNYYWWCVCVPRTVLQTWKK